MTGCRVRRGTALASRPRPILLQAGASAPTAGSIAPACQASEGRDFVNCTARRAGTGTGHVDPSRSPRTTRAQSPEIVTMCSVAP